MLYPIQNSIRNKLDISGIWDFQTDPDWVGEANSWAMGLAEPRPMAVPGSWNEQYDDLFGYLDLAWYVKTIHVPSGWKGQRVFIRVGSAVYLGTVYLNGVKVGMHEGGHLPFAFEITDQIKWGEENVLAISVENVLKPERVPSGNVASSAMSMFASTPATTYDFYPFSGIHRPVVLYSVPQTYIEDVTVVTDIEGAGGLVSVKVKLNDAVAGQGSVELKGDSATYQADLAFRDGLAEVTLTVP
ncbi:MAG: sugar-binding domain-containing protein, partial [Anaerolineae bacterium]